MKSILFTLLTTLLLVAGCATSVTSDITIESESDPTIKFSGYTSYTWLGSAAILYDPAGQWEPPGFDADAEITFLIDGELRQRGMSEDSANPDLIVVFAAGIDMAAMIEKIDPDSSIASLKNVPEGGLVVVLIDARTGIAVWAGLATAEIQQSPEPEVIKQRLKYAVASMFKQLPE
jgi:hypothetical protein